MLMFLIVKEIQVIRCTCSKVIDENHRRTVCSAVSGCFSVNIQFFCATSASLFGAGAAPFLTAPTPAPAPSKPFRRFRLRLRLRSKCVGSGGSGSGSGSGSASLLVTLYDNFGKLLACLLTGCAKLFAWMGFYAQRYSLIKYCCLNPGPCHLIT